MENCIWYDECKYKEECELCLSYNEGEEYIKREDFYKDWFEYIERINED